MTRLDWTNPLCDECWKTMHGDREPARLKEPEEEMCCTCGLTTFSGIYIRIDPLTVNFPRERED